MTTTRWVAAAAAVGLVVCSFALRLDARQESEEARRVREAATVFGEIMAAEDKAIPRAIIGRAEGIAIFPSTIRAGFVVGGMRGRGILSARNEGRWSAPAFMTLTGEASACRSAGRRPISSS